MKKLEMHWLRKDAKRSEDGRRLVWAVTSIQVEVMASVSGRAMVRRKGSSPFVVHVKDLRAIELAPRLTVGMGKEGEGP